MCRRLNGALRSHTSETALGVRTISVDVNNANVINALLSAARMLMITTQSIVVSARNVVRTLQDIVSDNQRLSLYGCKLVAAMSGIESSNKSNCSGETGCLTT